MRENVNGRRASAPLYSRPENLCWQTLIICVGRLRGTIYIRSKPGSAKRILFLSCPCTTGRCSRVPRALRCCRMCGAHGHASCALPRPRAHPTKSPPSSTIFLFFPATQNLPSSNIFFVSLLFSSQQYSPSNTPLPQRTRTQETTHYYAPTRCHCRT